MKSLNSFKEAMDPVNKAALKKKHKERKDQDINNDGKVNDTDKYLHNRRQAVTQQIGEKLKASDDMGKWIDDFQDSDAPQFKGKSKEKKRQMAIAAKLDAEKNESYKSYAQQKAVWASRKDGGKGHPDNKKKNESNVEEAKKMKGEDPCWDSHEMVGMKDKNGKKVPNCVPKNESAENRVDVIRAVAQKIAMEKEAKRKAAEKKAEADAKKAMANESKDPNRYDDGPGVDPNRYDDGPGVTPKKKKTIKELSNKTQSEGYTGGPHDADWVNKSEKLERARNRAKRMGDHKKHAELDAQIKQHYKRGPGVREAVDPQDKGEYDDEGGMAQTQINKIMDAAKELKGIIGKDDNLPEWVQSKMTKASDYIDGVRDYLKNKSDTNEATMPYTEEVELDEISQETLKSYKKKATSDAVTNMIGGQGSVKRLDKRIKGMKMADKRLNKEDYKEIFLNYISENTLTLEDLNNFNDEQLDEMIGQAMKSAGRMTADKRADAAEKKAKSLQNQVKDVARLKKARNAQTKARLALRNARRNVASARAAIRTESSCGSKKKHMKEAGPNPTGGATNATSGSKSTTNTTKPSTAKKGTVLRKSYSKKDLSTPAKTATPIDLTVQF